MDVHPLGPAAAGDPGLVRHLTGLVNAVYAESERGLWQHGAARTDEAEMAALIGAGEIVAATEGEAIVGSLRLHDVAADTSEFGILVASPERRGEGIGRLLADHAEDSARALGRRAMQLELLVPRNGSHPSKDFLRGWYGRRGYEVISTRRMDDAYPHLAPLLAVPCDLLVYEKPLRAGLPGHSSASIA